MGILNRAKNKQGDDEGASAITLRIGIIVSVGEDLTTEFVKK
jgi:hypothetical protein